MTEQEKNLKFNMNKVLENQDLMNHNPIFAERTDVMERYAMQMAEKHAKEVDRNFWLVVKEKPKWMPSFLYRAVIKNLVEFNKIK